MVSVKKRIFYLDELRALAILFVIFCHVCSYFPTTVEFTKSPILLGVVSIGRLGVPLFFMLSGSLLINKDYSLGSFFKKRFLRVLIPAIFWTFVLLTINQLFYGSGHLELSYYLSNAEFPWFVYAIIGIYLFIPIFNSFIKEYGDRGMEYFLLLWLIFIIATNLNYTNTNFEYIFDSMGIYIGFPVLGYYLANKKFKFTSIPIIVISGIIFVLFIIINFKTSFDQVKIISYYSVPLIIASSALFLIFRFISEYCEFKMDNLYSKFHFKIKDSWMGKLIYIFSACSYSIYLMHGIPINIIRFNFTIDRLIMVPAIFLIVSASSLIIVVILAKIPVINKLIGVKF